MGTKVINSLECTSYRAHYLPLIEKYFSEGFDVSAPPPGWYESQFAFRNITLNETGSVSGYCSLVLTNAATYQNILQGAIRENQMPPWQAGEYGLPYLYWASLIVENRTHAPYLIKSIFGEVAEIARKWELLITHVYSIAFTKVSERLMRRYFFERAGTYREGGHEYPVMLSKVADNPYLRAFIPVV